MGKEIDIFSDFEKYFTNLNSSHEIWENITLKKIKQDLIQDNMPDISISKNQASFLIFLIQSFKIKKILELGVYAGYSSLVMGLALKNLKNQNKKIIACDHNMDYLNRAASYWKEACVDEFIDPKLGDCYTILEEYNKKKVDDFDLIFIDADKKGYPDYYEKSLSLIQSGGFIIFDNVLWGGLVFKEDHFLDKTSKIMKQFNEYVFKDDRVWKTCLPIGDGFLWIIKK